MAAPSTTYPHLRLDESGRAWVDGANVKVSEVAADYLAHGSSGEEMAIQFPHLSPSMIHAALAYYYDHRAEYDEAFAASLQSSREKMAVTMDSPLRRRLVEASDKP
ncbi:MAG: DUF433 domain-containing protein [Verrucomicrobiota bacterium]